MAAGVASPAASAGPDDGVAARVIILANSDVPSSLAVARHYAAARNVPAANIIALPMPEAETITWSEFTARIWAPFLARLVQAGWVDAIAMDLTDAVGRRKYAVHRHRISALVTCRGVPLRIAHDPALYAEALPFTNRAEFRTNEAAVDGELGLLAVPNHPINAFVPNPLFQNDHPTDFERQQVVLVSRLDGPTVEDAMALVDRALTAERDGLLGRAYVDLSDRDAIGNGWLEATAAQLLALGFDTDVDRAPALLGLEARIDAPVLYFGWYSGDIAGVFTLPGFRFPPGAIALHIHSYSATTLRSKTSGWAGPLVDCGVTATVGNVFEPYLQLTHRPNLMLRALARGARWAEAGAYGLQGLSWQEVLIGDPLYRPFAVTLAEQQARLAQLPARRAGYAVLRQANLLDRSGHAADATALLRETQRTRPSLPVGVALAQRLRVSGDTEGAGAALAFLAAASGFASDEWTVARIAANLLMETKRPFQACDVWRILLRSEAMPGELRRPWLHEAAAAARAAGADTQAAAWEAESSAPIPPAGPS